MELETLVPTCKNKMSYIRSRFRNWSSRNSAKRLRKKMFDECNGMCPVCSTQMELATSKEQKENTATFDHIIPLLQTKKANDPENLRLICSKCNSEKAISDNLEIRTARAKRFWERYYNGEENLFVFEKINKKEFWFK